MKRSTSRPVIPLLGGVFAAVAMALAPAAASAAEPTNGAVGTERPRVLYRQAESAFAAGRFKEARQLLLEAWNIRRTYDVAAALGQAELELKLYRDAAEHLDFAVQHFAPMESEQALNGTKSDLLAAKAQVAEARITVSEPNARVTANGKAVGDSPLTASLFLEPGDWLFEAAVGPSQRVTQRLSLEKGRTYDVSLALPSSAGAPVSVRDTAPVERKLNYLPAVVSASIGGAALGTGVGLLLAAGSKDRARADLQAQLIGENGFGSGHRNPDRCADISDLAWSASRLRSGAYVSFGAALAAGVLTYVLWPRRHEGQPSLVLSPGYSPEVTSFDIMAIGHF